jgi:putative ABC transport system substrate-binding protein
MMVVVNGISRIFRGWTWAILVVIQLFIALPLAAQDQKPVKVWRIGYLSVSVASNAEPWFLAFRDALQKLGYVEGDNVIIDKRYAGGRLERLPALAAELVALNVDVLVTVPSGGAAAARKATGTIPIIFLGEPDPVQARLVATLARPGGNVTGLADAHADLVQKRLQFLKEIVPSMTRLGFLWNPANPSTRDQLRTAQQAASALGLEVLPMAVKGPLPEDIDRAFAAIATEGLGGLFVVGDPTLGAQRRRIAQHAVRYKLAASGPHKSWSDNGLLLSYGADFIDLSRRSAGLVDKILKGAKPADLPVEQPTQFELVVNSKTAKALGLTIPPSILLQASQVIQ